MKVSLQPANNPRNEYVGKQDWEGDCADKDGAIAAWKSLNGLEGIGVELWPLVVEEVKPVAKSKAVAEVK